MRVVCEALLRQSADFGVQTVAVLPDNRLQGREVKREVGQWSRAAFNAAFDYCRSTINHQTAVNGVIALDSK